MGGRARALLSAVTGLLVVVPGLGLVGISTADAATSLQLRVSASPNRTTAHALQGAVLSGGAYVFVGPSSNIARATFWVDDPHRVHSAKRTDTATPFDLLGGTTTAAHPWWTSGLREGTHHVTAQVTTKGGGHYVLQAVFTVRNTPRPPISPRTVAGDHKVTLFWHSSLGTTAGFNIYRSKTYPVARITPLNATKLVASQRSFVDTTAANGSRYWYVITAVTTHGLSSGASPTVNGLPLPQAPTPPPSPKNITATPGSGMITVDWTSGGGTTDGFNVYRSTSKNVPLTQPLNDLGPLAGNVTSYQDPMSTQGKYYYVVQAVSSTGAHSDPSAVASAKFGATSILLSSPKPVLYTQRNAGTVSGTVHVTNVGDADLTVTAADLSQGSCGSSCLTLNPGSLPFTLAGGAQRDLTFSFNPHSSGPHHATITVTSNDADDPSTTFGIGGLAVDNISTGEPSLQWIIDAYGIAADDGDPFPSSYQLNASAIPPSDGILVRGFTPRNSSLPVRVTALGAFVSPINGSDTPEQIALKNPAWGWMPQGNSPGVATAVFAGIRRDFIGTTYTINPTGRFNLWTKVEAATLSTDQNPSTAPRFIAFPVAGSPGTYVIANDTAGKTTDDWNDLPLLIENVDTIPPGTP